MSSTFLRFSDKYTNGRYESSSRSKILGMNKKFLQSMGKRIERCRDDLGATQKELQKIAEREYGVSISQNYLSQIEKGKAERPNVQIVAALAQHFGVSMDYLVGLTDNPYPPDGEKSLVIQIEDEQQRRLIDELIETVMDLPAERQQHVLQTARFLYGSRRPSIFGAEESAESTVMDFVLEMVHTLGGDKALVETIAKLEASGPSFASHAHRWRRRIGREKGLDFPQGDT